MVNTANVKSVVLFDQREKGVEAEMFLNSGVMSVVSVRAMGLTIPYS